MIFVRTKSGTMRQVFNNLEGSADELPPGVRKTSIWIYPTLLLLLLTLTPVLVGATLLSVALDLLIGALSALRTVLGKLEDLLFAWRMLGMVARTLPSFPHDVFVVPARTRTPLDNTSPNPTRRKSEVFANTVEHTLN